MGLRGSGAPDQFKQGSRAPEKLIKGSRLPYAFWLDPKANPRIKKIQQFLFFKRCFYKFFSTLLVFHSYLELFINHDQWMRLIFDTLNNVSGFEG